VVLFVNVIIFYGSSNSFTQTDQTNYSTEIDALVSTQASEIFEPKMDLGIKSVNGPYYLVWNETLWEESSTSSWIPFWEAGSQYDYTWSSTASSFHFLEEIT